MILDIRTISRREKREDDTMMTGKAMLPNRSIEMDIPQFDL